MAASCLVIIGVMGPSSPTARIASIVLRLKHRHIVAASCRSLASTARSKLVPCAAAPLPGKTASLGFTGVSVGHQSLSNLSTAMKASVGTCTVPRLRIFFLPSFCFSSSFFLRVMSPP